MKLEGTFTALITPFKEDFSVDIEGFSLLISRQIEAGVQGVVILGTTGEAVTLSSDEEELLIKKAVSLAKGKIQIIVGTGTNCTSTTIESTKRAQQLGADAALIVTPYYNKPTQEGLFLHYEAICKAINFPIILYNNPTRTCCNLDPATIARLSHFPHIIGMKECAPQMAEVLNLIPHFTVLSGDDVNAVAMIALGAKGVISAVSNLIPDTIVKMIEKALAHDFVRARQMHYGLLPLFKAALIETSPSPIKEAMALLELPSGPVRLPLCRIKPENRRLLEKVLTDLKLAASSVKALQ